MYKTIIRETDLPIQRILFWTDSTLTLQYILTKTHRLKTCVANRKEEVNEATEPLAWRHTAGGENPADILMRGMSDPSLLMEPSSNGTLWFEATPFLKKDEDTWPTKAVNQLDVHDPEIRKKSVLVGLGIVRSRKELS